jgi:DivIVA domain-containing protein
MIDLTPLDVRKKRGDFRKLMRGYDPSEVDTFLELAAERLEELVKENMLLRERSERLQEQVSALTERERAVNEALVTAQEIRGEIKAQAQREADLLRKEAQAEGRRILAEADRDVEQRRSALGELERRRLRFLGSFRQVLERELDALSVEEGRSPLEESPLDLELRGGRRHGHGGVSAPRRDDEAPHSSGGAEPLPPPEADVHALAAEGVGEDEDDMPDRWLDLDGEGGRGGDV